MEKQNSQLEHGQPIYRGLFCTCDSMWLAPVSFLANEFNVLSILQGQVRLEAVNQICVIHEAMNCCQNQKIH